MDDETLIARVVFALHTSAGYSCTYEEIRTCIGTTRRPKEDLLFILKKSQRFSIGEKDRIRLISPTKQHHPIQDQSKTGMLLFLAKAQQPLPQSKKDLRTVALNFMGKNSDFNLDVLASDILDFGYATARGGSLVWNTSRIQDLAAKMPSTVNAIKSVRETDAINTTRDTRTTATSQNNPVPGAAITQDDGQKWQTRNRERWKLPDGTTFHYVDTRENLEDVVESDQIFSSKQTRTGFVTLDCEVAMNGEGFPTLLELVQVAHTSAVYVFDAQTIGAPELCQALRPLLKSEHITKIIHDLHQGAVAFAVSGNLHLVNVLDTQLMMEHHFQWFNADLNSFLKKMDLPLHPSKGFVKGKMHSSPGYWSRRPLPSSDLEYAAMDVHFLMGSIEKLDCRFTQLRMLKTASLERAKSAVINQGARLICFDSSRSHCMASAELLRITKPTQGAFGSIHQVESEVEDVINVLPIQFTERIPGVSTGEVQRKASSPNQTYLDIESISDINIDIARRPECWIRGKREFLCQDKNIRATGQDIHAIVQHLGEIGHDNRAGLNGKMHRFSVMRARDESITGLTIRIGRWIHGMAELLLDLILGSQKSILLLGEPGSGKTTIVREVTQIMAARDNVVVVDTSNEIGGDGVQPHKSIGLARRMMVKSLDEQSKVMIECVQNHTPTCMVIDEIGRPKEVEAARTVRQRGVRIIASAHGNLRALISNKELNGLVGGLETVTLGDEMAKEEAMRKRKDAQASGIGGDNGAPALGPVNKNKTQRRSEPTFSTIIELGPRGKYLDWHVVNNVAAAVDDVLDGKRYEVERRFQNSETGAMFLEFKEV